MKKILHKAATRGHANHGWLDSHHTFSFAGYYNAERINFGALRVLNDDKVAGGQGFGTHPHDNMEIVSIPLKGALKHKDSNGNSFVIENNDVQIMSAGTGIYHSEYNNSATDWVNFLQIWVFPKERNIQPRYEQISFDPQARLNKLQLVVSPNSNDGALWINQNAYFSLATLETGKTLTYNLHDTSNGVYLFLLNGSLDVAGEKLEKRDGIGISETEQFELIASNDAEILLMEVPM